MQLDGSRATGLGELTAQTARGELELGRLGSFDREASSTTSTGGYLHRRLGRPRRRAPVDPAGSCRRSARSALRYATSVDSAGVPSSSSSLKRNPAIRFSPSVVGWAERHGEQTISRQASNPLGAAGESGGRARRLAARGCGPLIPPILRGRGFLPRSRASQRAQTLRRPQSRTPP